jgi:hypothetical protein
VDTGSLILDNVKYTLENASVTPYVGALCRIHNTGRLFFLDALLVQNKALNQGVWHLECKEADVEVEGATVFFLRGAGFSD